MHKSTINTYYFWLDSNRIHIIIYVDL